jgi:hypothetical protein
MGTCGAPDLRIRPSASMTVPRERVRQGLVALQRFPARLDPCVLRRKPLEIHRGSPPRVGRRLARKGSHLGARDLTVLKLIAGPKLHLIAAHHVERGFVVLMDVRLRPSAARGEGHGAEPQPLRTDTFGADTRGVIRPLLALVGLTGSYHESGVMPGCVHTGNVSSNLQFDFRGLRHARSGGLEGGLGPGLRRRRAPPRIVKLAGDSGTPPLDCASGLRLVS